jgi:oligopeptide/dipeptide ABC transporter ATP-binding protein
MYAGRLVEEGSRVDILAAPRHPYTIGLLRSIPSRGRRGERLAEIEGSVPSPSEWPKGCRFSTRCERVFDRCREVEPEAVVLSPSHRAACHDLAREQAP